MVKRREDLSVPRARPRFGVQYDSDAFGAFSESIASFIGTARFLVFQTVVIVVWITYNALAPDSISFDPWDRGLVLLTLVLSIQAAYAAPLILLAQSRQERRDRVAAQTDREVAERTQADTQFLAREIAGVRLALADMVTGHDLDERMARLAAAVERLTERVDELTSGTARDVPDSARTSDRREDLSRGVDTSAEVQPRSSNRDDRSTS